MVRYKFCTFIHRNRIVTSLIAHQTAGESVQLQCGEEMKKKYDFCKCFSSKFKSFVSYAVLVNSLRWPKITVLHKYTTLVVLLEKINFHHFDRCCFHKTTRVEIVFQSTHYVHIWIYLHEWIGTHSLECTRVYPLCIRHSQATTLLIREDASRLKYALCIYHL